MATRRDAEQRIAGGTARPAFGPRDSVARTQDSVANHDPGAVRVKNLRRPQNFHTTMTSPVQGVARGPYIVSGIYQRPCSSAKTHAIHGPNIGKPHRRPIDAIGRQKVCLECTEHEELPIAEFNLKAVNTVTGPGRPIQSVG